MEKNMAWKIILSFLFGYLLGAINPAYIIGKLRGMDIRKDGSKNAGASNALLLLGKFAAIFSAIFDIMKAAVAVWVAPLIFSGVPLVGEVAGVAAIVGHIYPVWMKFRGGKGTACLGGLLLAIDWRLLLILLAIEIVVAVVTNYLCMVPITAAVAIPVIYGVFGDAGLGWLLNAHYGWSGAAVLGAVMLLILFVNLKNINRLVHGVEMHFNYVWSNAEKKDAEIARIRANQARWDEQKAQKEQSK
jgi:glycerol-3-phosphate acyltransferase PlsY